MRTIREKNKKIAKVLGYQKIKEVSYRLMNYVTQVEVEEEILLYNVISGQLIVLNCDEWNNVKSLPLQYHSGLSELVKDYFLVPEEYEEVKLVKQLRNILRAMDQNRIITGYTILPTTYCNARCYYCYEANIAHIHMTEETAHDVAEFIKNNHGDQKVSLSWFGGEPTLGSARINQICQELRDAGVKYTSTMISNGYLFDEKLVKEAVDLWKLKRIQITLDGTEEVYNKVKAYPGVKGSPYQKVLNNIQLLLNLDVFVSIRTNLSYANVEDLKVLADELKKQFAEYENFHLYSHTLFAGDGFEPVIYEGDEEDDLINIQVGFNQSIAKWNKTGKQPKGLPYLKYRHCMADNSSSIIINPDGSLSRCEHCLEDHCGHINKGLFGDHGLHYWRDYAELPCCDCVLYPSCVVLDHCSSNSRCLELERNVKIVQTKKNIKSRYLEFAANN